MGGGGQWELCGLSKPQRLWDKKGLPRCLSGVWGSMSEPKKKAHIFPTSPHLQPLMVSVFQLDEPQHMLGLREHFYKQTHCVYLHDSGGGSVLRRGTIRNQTSFFTKHKFTSILLIFGCRARVNQRAAWLAVAEKQRRTAVQLLSSHYRNKTPHCSEVTGNAAVQLQWRGWERGDLRLHTRKQFFKCLRKRRKKSETAASFPSLEKNVQ